MRFSFDGTQGEFEGLLIEAKSKIEALRLLQQHMGYTPYVSATDEALMELGALTPRPQQHMLPTAQHQQGYQPPYYSQPQPQPQPQPYPHQVRHEYAQPAYVPTPTQNYHYQPTQPNTAQPIEVEAHVQDLINSLSMSQSTPTEKLTELPIYRPTPIKRKGKTGIQKAQLLSLLKANQLRLTVLAVLVPIISGTAIVATNPSVRQGLIALAPKTSTSVPANPQNTQPVVGEEVKPEQPAAPEAIPSSEAQQVQPPQPSTPSESMSERLERIPNLFPSIQ